MSIAEKNESLVAEDAIQNAVHKLFGLNYLFPYQRLAVSNILEAAEAAGVGVKKIGETGASSLSSAESTPFNNENAIPCEGAAKDAASLGRQIIILPTGAGKSLCFQLPAMLLDGPTLVIYPILSLMADQERSLLEKNLTPVTLRGGQSAEEREAVWEGIKNKKNKFIISNPETLLTPKTLRILPSLGIAHVVIDEAHCVSEWGESFRPSYKEIDKIIKASGAPIVTAFTATASAPVLEKINHYIFGSSGAHRIIGNPDRPNISYSACGAVLRDAATRLLLLKNERPAIVFCSSRPGTEKLARYLRASLNEKEVRFYHAGLEREEKSAVEKWFFSSRNGILVATCAYGMGVDKADVRTVIHRDFPPSVEAYLQESGRAGRDGGFSRAFLIWGPDDENALKRAGTDYEAARLGALMNYARDSSKCRREVLLSMLNYEGDGVKPETECCDVCAIRAETVLAEEKALVEFFRKNPRSFTTEEAAATVSSLPNSIWSKNEVSQAVRGLINAGRLKKISRFPWKNKITAASKKR
ncbi:MAG: RecQ family ATP-dependent DNA helicase [Spirochaetaceae bacterium]|jgi:ATP-dependent DNA helicase RecQ|nr:RecQ family ATP-dependent DNA helicase [Spirochaetaceae bacterium]